jgi:hypothetical protein
MSTAYDFITVAIFAGLIVLFLQRSLTPEPFQDSLYQYLIAAIGCAVANFLGNQEAHLFAVAAILATLFYIHLALRPFERKS